MKKLLIVDVPDDATIVSFTYRQSFGYTDNEHLGITESTTFSHNFKEITLPSDEEIDAMSKQKPINSGHISNRKMGAKFIINKILNQ